MRVLIVGCGYVGSALGAELARCGHKVFGMRRNRSGETELSSVGIRPLTGDVTDPMTLRHLPEPFDWVVNCVSATAGGLDAYRRIYLEGTINLVKRFAPRPPKKFVYTSSTSVYGQDDGSIVDETSPTEPASESARILVETEKVLLEAAFRGDLPAVILRVAGIYGPGRCYWLKRFTAGQCYGEGDRILNMVHRDDVVGAIIAALQRAPAGAVYNVVDDEPVAKIQLFRWLAGALGKPMQPTTGEEPDGDRKRGYTNKRVLNRKLKTELGYRFKYPTFRQGYGAEIRQLAQDGK